MLAFVLVLSVARALARAGRVAYDVEMTPQETMVVRALVAVAWADGDMQAPETGVIEGLLAGFDASDAETAEVLEFARTPRTLRDIVVEGLGDDDKDTLLRNAALLVCADGVETEAERTLLAHLADILELGEAERGEILLSVRAGVGDVRRSF